MRRLKKLFEPIRVGSMELKNRIKLPAINLGYAVDEMVTQRLKDFYTERAKGGVGLIGITVSTTRGYRSPVLGIYDDRFIPGLRELVETCHAHGVKVYAQMGVGYAWSFNVGSVELVSPSGISIIDHVDPPFQLGGPPTATSSSRRELKEHEILQMIEAYGDGARRARQIGFDAVELLSGVGYVTSQFMSPLTNKRTDKYGGSFENRMRFLLETVENVRRKAGSDYTIMARFSGQLMKEGFTLDDIKRLSQMLEGAGVQALDITPAWHEDIVPQIIPSVPMGTWVYLAEEVKKVVKVPVVASTRISDLSLAEKILTEGKADMVSIARALIADPELPNKAREGRLDEIRPCIASSYCFETMSEESGVVCEVNPRAGREGEYIMAPAARSKRVFVIGGGPAGMEAATTAAQRGHEVTLIEKGKELGGQLATAALPPYKEELNELRRFLISQVEASNVNIKLNAKATAEAIMEGNPDSVIVATGARPIIPDILGIEKPKVITAPDALRQPTAVGERVVIIGGGLVGCETAELLAQKGKKVTILEMLGRIASDVGIMTRRFLLHRLREAGIRMETDINVEEITDEGVKGVRDDKLESFAGDTVVLALGMRANKELAEELRGKVTELYLIGDCAQPRRITEAIGEGFETAWRI